MKPCACKRYRGPLRTIVDVRRRCTARHKIARSLYTIASDREKRMSVARCLKCRTVWAEEVVFDEGDDMRCLYTVKTEEPPTWLQGAAPMAQVVVREDEDRRFFDALGVEEGPRPCLYDGCPSLPITGSDFCRRHHFEVVQGRPCPW